MSNSTLEGTIRCRKFYQ